MHAPANADVHHVRVQQPSSDERFLPEQPAFPSARSMLFTILGGLVFADPEPVWTSSLLYVMKAGGFTEQAARQAIARGAAAGWITAGRWGRETRWTLGPELITMFEEGKERVFAFSDEPAPWDGQWLVVITSIPHEQRTVRKKLYGALRWAGLGNPTPGIWLTPHVDRAAEVDRVISELDLRSSTLSFVGQPAAIGLSDAEIIERAWDLEEVAATYDELLARFSRLDPEPGDEVLLAHLELTSALRHFPFIDPQLPETLIPDWIGREATRRLRELNAGWAVAAQSRWRGIVATTAPR
jgi:phenylacetic acid degradation operon negative regulatory protein